jgi:hypothetical protein
VGTGGSVYLGGQYSGEVDFDPGASVAMRTAPPPSFVGGFVAKLGQDGTFNWVQTLSAPQITVLAGTADGGVIATGPTINGANAIILKLNADKSPGWTLPVESTSDTFFTAIDVNASGFVLAGNGLNGNASVFTSSYAF